MLSFPGDRAVEITPILGKSPYISPATAAYFHDALSERGGRGYPGRNYNSPLRNCTLYTDARGHGFWLRRCSYRRPSFQFRVMQLEVGARVIHWCYYGLNFSLYNEGEMHPVTNDITSNPIHNGKG